MSENNWNHFKIVPQGHHNCQLSIVNCQFGEAAKFQFISVLTKAYNLRQHRTNASSDLSGSFAPVLQFQKWEIHTVFPHF